MNTLLACTVGILGIGAASQVLLGQAAPGGGVGRITYVPGSSKKICQLTGEMDRELGQPTVNQTGTRFGLVSSDRGYSFEHDGKVFFLFGDTQPRPKFNGKPNGPDDPPRMVDDNDAIAFSTDKAIGACATLDFVRNAIGAYQNPVVLNAQGKPAIKLRTNESPISGTSQGGRMYVIFGTDNPTDTAHPPEKLGYSTRTVMAVSGDDAKTFHYLYDFSKGPGARFINTAIAHGTDGYLYFWGTQGGELYRKSAPYAARMEADDIGKPDGGQSIEYFTGLGPDQTPRFSRSEADAVPLFQDSVESQPANCMGEVGVDWNRFIKRWVMLYNCRNHSPEHPRGIYMRLAEQPWGPWTAAQTIFSPVRDSGYCHFIHRAVKPGVAACDDVSGPNRVGIYGGEYGPYVISRFTTGDEARGTSTFYFTMDTWNPYDAVIMRAEVATSQ